MYAGTDPLTWRAIRLKATVKSEQQAHTELGRLRKEASEGRTPESCRHPGQAAGRARGGRGVGRVHAADQRGVHPPHHQARSRASGGAEGPRPILDKPYTRLKRCGGLSCTGRPITEHRNVPVLVINPRDPRLAWQQVTEALTEAIQSGSLAPGDELPSITELSALQDIGTDVIRHAFEALTADGLIIARHGRARSWPGAPRSGPAYGSGPGPATTAAAPGVGPTSATR